VLAASSAPPAKDTRTERQLDSRPERHLTSARACGGSESRAQRGAVGDSSSRRRPPPRTAAPCRARNGSSLAPKRQTIREREKKVGRYSSGHVKKDAAVVVLPTGLDHGASHPSTARVCCLCARSPGRGLYRGTGAQELKGRPEADLHARARHNAHGACRGNGDSHTRLRQNKDQGHRSTFESKHWFKHDRPKAPECHRTGGSVRPMLRRVLGSDPLCSPTHAGRNAPK